jgi:hypothetical protein
MTAHRYRRCCLLAILVVGHIVTPAPATTIDTSPRHAILLGKSARFLAQDAWDSVALYAVADGRLVRRFPAGQRVNAIDVTADEGLLLVAGAGGGIGVWDLETGTKVWWIGPFQTGLGYVYDASFARDGRSCIVCGYEGFALVYESRTGRQVAKVGFPPGQTLVLSACLSPDGSRGALVDLGERVFTFDVRAGAMQDTGLTGAWPVRSAADGKRLGCRSANSGVQERLRVVALDPPPTARDVGQFACIGHIRPAEGGDFLVTAEAGQRAEGTSVVGVRYSPGRDQVEELWRLGAGRGVNRLTDFDPETLLGVSTDFRLVTTLTDLRTGTSRLVIDNSANFRPEIVTSSSVGGSSWLLPGCGAVTLVLAGLLAVMFRRYRARRGSRALAAGGRAESNHLATE